MPALRVLVLVARLEFVDGSERDRELDGVLIGGRERPQITIAEYDAAWPARFEAERMRVKDALGVRAIQIEHIGSTAVPGLAAKPIIDLMPLVTDLADLDRERWRVEALGYHWHGELGLSGRRYCTLSDETGIRFVQLHFFKADSPHVVRHLAFRNYLRAHPKAAAAYENEKRRARDLHPNDSHAYTDEKDAWIRNTEATALIWFSEQHDPAFYFRQTSN